MKNLVFIVLLFSMLSCDNNSLQNQIIGKWGSTDNENFVEFTEDGFYNIYIDGKHIREISNFDSMTYIIKEDNTFPELFVYDKNQDLYQKNIIQLENDNLINVSFKKGKNIDHHIDEYSIIYKRGQAQKKLISNQKLKLIFPENYKGISLIIYNQSDGKEPDYDENGNKIYSIPQSGILKTSSKIESDPFKIAKGEIEFYFQDGNDNQIQLDNFEALSNVNKSQVNVKIFGYNQIGRSIVNDIINDDTNNNMLFLSIDSAKILNKTTLYDNFVRTFKSTE